MEVVVVIIDFFYTSGKSLEIGCRTDHVEVEQTYVLHHFHKA